MAAHVSVLSYFVQAGFVVKTVMLFLLVASVASWTLILQRAWFFKQKQLQYDVFTRRFWGSSDLSMLYADIDSKIEEREGIASIFHAGFKEFLRIRPSGTVWGIMTSFQALGQAQQATIAMVAPGISEALVATALGLFTAIPAVIAFNRYSTRANSLLDRYDLFQEEFVTLIEQQMNSSIKG